MQLILKKIFGTKNERDLKKLQPLVDRMNALELEYQALSETDLQGKTAEFKKRLKDGESIDDLMCEAFATVKNVCRRLTGRQIQVCESELTWDMVPFDVQLLGGITLHEGKIAEMATGEGKTLVATMPVYLNALSGEGVHVVTTNDFLALRDATWMGNVYEYLGLTVGCIQNMMSPEDRRVEYEKDITYGTNSEFGFDYLRDNMTYSQLEQVQRSHNYCIIDEIDSILIDEARTPLIISGPAPYSTKQYTELRPAVSRLVKRQRDLCTRFMNEAKRALGDEEEEKAQLLLYQVGQGMPKNKQFMQMMEDPAIRRLYEKIDNAMLTDMRKEQSRALREELFFNIDEKGNDASLTEKGCSTLNPNDPEMYLLPDIVSAMSELDGDESLSEEEKFEKRQKIQDQFSQRSEHIHAVDQLIRAFSVYEKDVQYVVQDNQVMIVDEFTGRLMPGRRWSDGLHQAIEAKENVKVERETQTLATITIQNYFRMYNKLSGMTGTAETEANEFADIYKLDVVVITTNRPVRRVDLNDQIYKTQREKYNAIVDEVRERSQSGQPVLLGTASVESSEHLSRMLRKQNIPHNVLNAKNHQSEAEIVMRAGQPGAITIATNMAGRGTDIKLGKDVVYLERDTVTSQISLEDKYEDSTLRKALIEKPCGLYVIGSERHEARRIDRQLRGRCARQGDPGMSRFYISLEDDLMRLFGSDRISSIMEKLGIQEGEVLEHPWLNRSIETAQRRVEQHNFSIRKRTLEYDDVMNKQREIIYGFRTDVLQAESVQDHLYDLIYDVILTQVEVSVQEGDDFTFLLEWVDTTFPIGMRMSDIPTGKDIGPDQVADAIFDRVKAAHETKVRLEDPESLTNMERHIMLQAIDSHWQEYLRGMDALRQGVGLRAYGQRDPLVEYKREAYTMFADLMDKIKNDVAHKIFRSATSYEAFTTFITKLPQQFVHDEVHALGDQAPEAASQEAAARASSGHKQKPVTNEGPGVGRNDPCPCGSGKKFKKCCGVYG